MTDAGVIPADWYCRRMDELAVVGSGTTPARSQHARYFAGGTHCWVKTLDLNNGELFDTDERVTDFALAETSLRLFPAGTVLVAMYGGFAQIGRTGLLAMPAAINQALAAVQPHSVLPRYLINVLNYRVSYWHAVAASSRKDPNITKDDIRRFPVAIPPTKDEQEAIAEALSDADALIKSLEHLIAKKRLIKQGAMQELLTGKRRLPGFEGEWVTRPVDAMGEVVAGKALNVNGPGKFRPYLRTKNVLDGHIDLEDVLEMPMTDSEFRHFGIRYGDVLLNEGQSIDLVGRCAMYRDEALFECAMQNQLLRFRAFATTDPGFSEHLFRYCQHTGVFSSISTQTTSVAHLGRSRFAELKLRWPATLKEQSAVAAVLSDMDSEIAALERRTQKARQLKQGMMQQLLTGRIRLV